MHGGFRVASFIIDGTDFGIDEASSAVDISTKDKGRLILNVEIKGDKQRHSQITENESSPWSWTLYPPRFYLREYPVSGSPTKGMIVRLMPDDTDNYDVAIYMMEHNGVDGVVIKIGKQGRVEISGRVGIDGKWLPFTIDWSK